MFIFHDYQRFSHAKFRQVCQYIVLSAILSKGFLLPRSIDFTTILFPKHMFVYKACYYGEVNIPITSNNEPCLFCGNNISNILS